MGITEVLASVIGPLATKEYRFLVDTGSTYLALPLEEIEALGVEPTQGKVKLMSATSMVEVDTYFGGEEQGIASGELRGERFGAIMVPASTPLIGVELLENLRYRVNPVTEQIERVPDGERHPPYQL